MYSKPIDKIARSLIMGGRSVTLVRCNDILSACALKLGSNINSINFVQICKNCVLKSKIISALTQCKTVDLIFSPTISPDVSKLSYQELINFSYKSFYINSNIIFFYDYNNFNLK